MTPTERPRSFRLVAISVLLGHCWGCVGIVDVGEATLDNDEESTLDNDEGRLAQAAPPLPRSAADCPPSQPHWVGGTLKGGMDGRAVNAMMGIVWWADNKSAIFDRDGVSTNNVTNKCVHTANGYSECIFMNKTLPAVGSTTTGETRWGACVGRGVKIAAFEIYPKAPGVKGISHERFGGTTDLNVELQFKNNNSQQIDFVLPVGYEFGGNTGLAAGYVRCDDKFVKPTRGVAWSQGSPSGIKGFGMSLPSELGPNHYKVNYLAAGQGSQVTQSYALFVSYSCRSQRATTKVIVRVDRATRGPGGMWQGTIRDISNTLAVGQTQYCPLSENFCFGG